MTAHIVCCLKIYDIKKTGGTFTDNIYSVNTLTINSW